MENTVIKSLNEDLARFWLYAEEEDRRINIYAGGGRLVYIADNIRAANAFLHGMQYRDHNSVG